MSVTTRQKPETILALIAASLLVGGPDYAHGFFLERSNHILKLPDCLSNNNRNGSQLPQAAVEAKRALLSSVCQLEGINDPENKEMKNHIETLKHAYEQSNQDARTSENFCGDWLNANVPEFPGRVGTTSDGLPLYSIGRLTFNKMMLSSDSALDTPCVVEKMMQRIHPIAPEDLPSIDDLPEEVREDYRRNSHALRTNIIDTFFRIPNTPVRGILRMLGYALPSTDHRNRWNKWFEGGVCIPRDCTDGQFDKTWTSIFGAGDLSYSLGNPVVAHQTVLYLDESLRIGIGSRGTAVVLVK